MLCYDENGILQIKNLQQLHKKINNCNKYKHNKVVKKDILFYQLCNLFVKENEKYLRIKLIDIYQIYFSEEEEIRMLMKEIIKIKKENCNRNFNDIVYFLINDQSQINNSFNIY